MDKDGHIIFLLFHIFVADMFEFLRKYLGGKSETFMEF